MEDCKQSRSALLFYVGNSLYMISVKNIVTITSIPKRITHVPHSPKHIYGVCNIKGENFTLVDLNQLLKTPSLFTAREAEHQTVIALDCNVALCVEEIIGVEPMDDFLLLQKNIITNHFIKNYYRPNETMWDYKFLKGKNEIAFELDIMQIENFRQNLL